MSAGLGACVDTARVDVLLAVVAWYITSFGTLLLNKYLLGTRHVQPNTLAVVQMVSTAIYGALKTLHLRRFFQSGRLSDVLPGAKAQDGAGVGCAAPEDPSRGKSRAHQPWRRALMQMGVVGAMRFATVVLGLVSLKYIAASFTETIKASAPFFTVIIAYLMLGEKTSPLVVTSLVPVAIGLVLVSLTELSFTVVGFCAAVATNVIECVQNVFSKSLLAGEYTASQLQFYTSLTALILQAPIFLYQMRITAGPQMHVIIQGSENATLANGIVASDVGAAADADASTAGFLALLWIDGVLYHLQSVAAYVVMSYLSPVTVSVVNTLKRALLIWISVLVFGNQVTFTSGIGTIICLGGALWYNVARQQQTRRRTEVEAPADVESGTRVVQAGSRQWASEPHDRASDPRPGSRARAMTRI